MADNRHVPVDELQPGQKLARDIMVQNSVLLRRGTVLTDANISRIMRLGLDEVLVEVAVGEAPPHVESIEDILIPDFKRLASDETPAWMSQEDFSSQVPKPQQMPVAEWMFAEKKEKLRAQAGLRPIIDPAYDAEMTKGVHAAFIASAVKGQVDLDRLGDIAGQLTKELEPGDDGYISFVDVSQYGQGLATRSMMSSKVFCYAALGNGHGELNDQMFSHLAVSNAFALLPADLLSTELLGDWSEQKKLKDALLKYYEWLRSQRIVVEKVLETMLLRFERHDGSGIPYGLKGEMIPPLSQNWSLAWHYSGQLYSRPKTGRILPNKAAESLVRQSGRAFAGASVNKFLRKIGYYPNGALVELSDERLGIVVAQNQHALLKPVVRLVDTEGKMGPALDLTSESELFITRQVMEY